MTSKELFNKLKPSSKEEYVAQALTNGLSVNMSGIYSQLIKEAARCNNYNSDVVYDIESIQEKLAEFRQGDSWEPVFVGFRRHGVDGTDFVTTRCESPERAYEVIFKEYFALYSVDVEAESDGWYKIMFYKYNT